LKPETSLLWQITGNSLKKPSFLYGTIHIQDKRVFSFDNIVLDKLYSCDAYAMETLLDDIDPAKLQKVFLMRNNTLKNLLNEKEYNKLKTLLADKFNLDISALEKTKPMFLSSRLLQFYEMKEMPEALDLYFYKIAKEKGKILLGIEKFSEQISAVNKVSLYDQCNMLRQLINKPDAIENKFNELLNAYLDSDFTKILKLTKDKSISQNFNNVFIINRNRIMAERIIKYSKKYSVFFALGTGHLAGKDGIINLLKNKGFILTPLKFSFNYETSTIN
jgi:uncharacterized protein YbaP (TraB family)